MRHLIMLLFACSFLMVSCFGEDPSECNDACEVFKDIDDATGQTLFSNYGDCVSLCATCADFQDAPAGKRANCFCEGLETFVSAVTGDQVSGWELLGVKNKGQCIKLVKDGLSGNPINPIGISN